MVFGWVAFRLVCTISILAPFGFAAEALHYAGSAACQPCHNGIFRAFAKSGMARASGSVDTIADGTSLGTASFAHGSSGWKSRAGSGARV